MSSGANSASYTIQTTYSSNANVCPVCHGSGWELFEKAVPELYGNDIAVYFARECQTCKGGHSSRVEQVMKLSDIPVSYYNKPYSAFSWNIYKDDEGNPIDLSKQEKFISSFLNEYEKWEKRGLGLYIWSGMKGSGKSFLSSCICNELMKRYAMQTRFVSAANLLDIAKSGDPEALDKYKRNPIDLLCNCKLLVIDDLGAKKAGNEWMNDILFQITDARMTKKLVTIITSNIPMRKLELDDRVCDRINKLCQSIPLPNYCVRAREANEDKAKFFKELGLT